MNRTVTVKGVGKLKLRPDQTVVSLSLKAIDKLCDRAMGKAAEELERLKRALAAVGFSDDSLKTADFQVGTEYESERDESGNYRQVFVGFCVRHRMKLEFPLDNARLSEVLGAVSACVAEPELDIRFTVKDSEAVEAALLESACANARAKAEILAKAAGASLSRPISIDYSWGDLYLYSPARYEREDGCMPKACAAAPDLAIEPDDISVSDSVTFVWELCVKD